MYSGLHSQKMGVLSAYHWHIIVNRICALRPTTFNKMKLWQHPQSYPRCKSKSKRKSLFTLGHFPAWQSRVYTPTHKHTHPQFRPRRHRCWGRQAT